jgi:hypothetical protein
MSKNRILGPLLGSQAHTSPLATHRLASLGSHASVAGTAPPFFEACPAPTLGSVKCSIPHGDWRFHFFPNYDFPLFRIHLDLLIYRWDFVS